jgi:hypothetical protein
LQQRVDWWIHKSTQTEKITKQATKKKHQPTQGALLQRSKIQPSAPALKQGFLGGWVLGGFFFKLLAFGQKVAVGLSTSPRRLGEKMVPLTNKFKNNRASCAWPWSRRKRQFVVLGGLSCQGALKKKQIETDVYLVSGR